jgi:acyl transferase domain-containing protein
MAAQLPHPVAAQDHGDRLTGIPGTDRTSQEGHTMSIAEQPPVQLVKYGGVYFGISCFDYTLEIGALSDEELDAYVGSTSHSAVPGRISYLLGWRGPSIAIDTACSSSIVALDLAVQGLRRGDCEIAVCGGVNAIHYPLNHIVFAESHSSQDLVIVGSLKTNVGHMEAAAGIGGVIKTALQLHHAQIYPHLNVVNPSEHIPWDKYPVTLPMAGSPWQAPVRRALVNSFGFAGTIASAVLEQAPPARVAVAEPDEPVAESQVFALSAKSEKALRLQADKYRRFLESNPNASLKDICYTAAVGRAHFDERIAGVVADHDELAALLARGPAGAGLRQGAGFEACCYSLSEYLGEERPRLLHRLGIGGPELGDAEAIAGRLAVTNDGLGEL